MTHAAHARRLAGDIARLCGLLQRTADEWAAVTPSKAVRELRQARAAVLDAAAVFYLDPLALPLARRQALREAGIAPRRLGICGEERHARIKTDPLLLATSTVDGRCTACGEKLR